MLHYLVLAHFFVSKLAIYFFDRPIFLTFSIFFFDLPAFLFCFAFVYEIVTCLFFLHFVLWVAFFALLLFSNAFFQEVINIFSVTFTLAIFPVNNFFRRIYPFIFFYCCYLCLLSVEVAYMLGTSKFEVSSPIR